MAEGGKLRGDDPVRDGLLSQIASHINVNDLKLLAVRHLGIGSTEFDNTVDGKGDGINKTVALLERWRNKEAIQVEDLLASVLKWGQSGFIQPQVWDTLKGVVHCDVIDAAHRSDERRAAPRRQTPEKRNRRPALLNCLPNPFTWSKSKSAKLTEEDILIQQWTKDSLEQSLDNCLSNDWLPPHRAQAFNLLEYYLEVEYEETKVTPRRRKKVDKMNLYGFLKKAGKRDKSLNYLILGPAGIGKSSCLSSIAMNWAQQIKDELKRFEFAFLIRLRDVDQNCPLENLIINNHYQLSENEVSPAQIKSILHNHNTLIMLDGYDEYPSGTNDAIDEAIEHTVGNKCVLLLTSRPEAVEDTEHTLRSLFTGHTSDSQAAKKKPNIKKFMRGLITIKGFSKKTIKKYCKKYFGDPKTTKAIIKQAGEVKIDDLLHIPTLLLMVCAIYDENESLPESSTKVFHDVYELMISRSMLRLTEAERQSEEQLYNARYLLGRLSLEALKKDTLYISQADLTADIIKMGVVFPIGPGRTVLKGEKWFGFHHKSVMEFSGSDFLSKDVKDKSPEQVKEVLTEWFPSWDELKKHQQVIYFLCEQLEGAHRQVLIEYVWEKTWSGEILPASDRHTEYGHYYSKTAPVAIHTLSRRYRFDGMVEAVEWTVPPGTTVPDRLKECKVWIRDPRQSVAADLLSVVSSIRQHQRITELVVYGVKADVSPISTLHGLRDLHLTGFLSRTSLQALQSAQTDTEREDIVSSKQLPALPALPESIEWLDLLGRLEDVSEVVRAAARPTLRVLGLAGMSEAGIEEVVEAAATQRPHQELILALRKRDLSPECRQRLEQRLQGTQIILSLVADSYDEESDSDDEGSDSDDEGSDDDDEGSDDDDEESDV